jgi:hypothetical protein
MYKKSSLKKVLDSKVAGLEKLLNKIQINNDKATKEIDLIKSMMSLDVDNSVESFANSIIKRKINNPVIKNEKSSKVSKKKTNTTKEKRLKDLLDKIEKEEEA